MPPFTVSRVFVLVALILFVLAAFSVSLGGVGVLALGRAFLAGSMLVP